MIEMVESFRGAAVLVYGDEHYHVGVEQLSEAVSPRTRVLVFSSPANPSGSVYSADEVHAIADWALAAGIWVISDEIYEHLVYDESRFASMGAEQELAERCFVISGLAKGFGMPGWRLGWVTGPAAAVADLACFQSYSFSFVPGVSQAVGLAALEHRTELVSTVVEALSRRRRLLVDGLNSLEGVHCAMPEGGLYCFANVEGVFGHPLRGERAVHSSVELAKALEWSAGVRVLPGESFSMPGRARLSFGLGNDDIEEGIRRMRQLIGDNQGVRA